MARRVCLVVLALAFTAVWCVEEPQQELAAPAGAGGGGDAYLSEAEADCATTGAAWPCSKAKALRLAARVANTQHQVELWGPVSVAPVPGASSGDAERPLFEWSTPRDGDSEADKAAKFGLRMLDKFARTHAIRVDLEPSDAEGLSEGRGKKKKAAVLLPIVLFLKLKALLVPTLLGVLFIKKLLVLAAIFLPALLSYIKVCKVGHHHHPVSYHSVHSTGWDATGSGHSASAAEVVPSGYGHPGHYAASRKHLLAGGRRKHSVPSY